MRPSTDAMTDIGESFVPRRAAVAAVELDGEMVLARGERGSFYRLDPLASLIWSCLDGSGTAGEIADDLAAEFGANTEVVRQDVVTWIRTLARLGFLAGAGQAVTAAAGGTSSGDAPTVPYRLVDPPSG